jgi:hypothetical protein
MTTEELDSLAGRIAERIWKNTPPPEKWDMNTGDWFDWLKKEVLSALEGGGMPITTEAALAIVALPKKRARAKRPNDPKLSDGGGLA